MITGRRESLSLIGSGNRSEWLYLKSKAQWKVHIGNLHLPVIWEIQVWWFGHHLRAKVHSDFLSFEVGKKGQECREKFGVATPQPSKRSKVHFQCSQSLFWIYVLMYYLVTVPRLSVYLILVTEDWTIIWDPSLYWTHTSPVDSWGEMKWKKDFVNAFKALLTMRCISESHPFI